MNEADAALPAQVDGAMLAATSYKTSAGGKDMNKIKAAVLAHYTFVVPAQAGTQEALLDTRPGLIPAGAGSNARV